MNDQKQPLSGDPLPSIPEHLAEGEIAEIYADIRRTMNMSFINLVWRTLAAVPGGLKWSWLTMKPLYESGVAFAEARALTEGVDVPVIPPLPLCALPSVGVRPDDERAIRAALDGYEVGNPLNLVTFSALLAVLRGDAPNEAKTLPPEAPAPPSRYGETPSLLNFNQMTESTASMVRQVSLIGALNEANNVQVSLPRNLAHWPGFLALYWTVLAPFHNDGSLGVVVGEVLQDGERRGKRLATLLHPPTGSSQETLGGVQDILENLVPNAMGRMIPVVALLKKMMPVQG